MPRMPVGGWHRAVLSVNCRWRRGCLTEEKPGTARNDEQPAIGQPIEAEWKNERNVDHDFAVAIETARNNLLGTQSENHRRSSCQRGDSLRDRSTSFAG